VTLTLIPEISLLWSFVSQTAEQAAVHDISFPIQYHSFVPLFMFCPTSFAVADMYTKKVLSS
jgi:hypothetical protein